MIYQKTLNRVKTAVTSVRTYMRWTLMTVQIAWLLTMESVAATLQKWFRQKKVPSQ